MKIHLIQIALNKMSLKKRTFSENNHKPKLKYVYYKYYVMHHIGIIKDILNHLYFKLKINRYSFQ